MSADLMLKSQLGARIRWSSRGSCGNPGCTDPECGCSLCGLPIGVAEDDPRWASHEDDCSDCELCRDLVPIMIFRGVGEKTEQANFHVDCFKQVILVLKAG